MDKNQEAMWEELHLSFRVLDGYQEWRKDGKLHRVYGPAAITSIGNQYWYQNGKLHRIDGPALIYKYTGARYFLYGTEFTEQEFNKITAKIKVDL